MPLFTPAASEDAPPTGPTFGLLWHTFSVDEALDRSHGSFSGLTAPEAARRLERDGRNVIVPVPPRSLAVDLARTLLRPAHLLLAALAAGSFASGRHGLAAAFAALTLVTTLARTLADRRTRSSLTALRELAAPVGRAMRDDRLVDLPAAELVVGDVVEIEAGDVVPADCRLLRARSLTVDESPLTGETAFAHKGVAPVERHAPLDARSCLAFAGSVVVAGSARGLVVATGMATEAGRLGAASAQAGAVATPLQTAVAAVARRLALAAAAASLVVAGVSVLRGRPAADAALLAGALLAAALPEQLPILAAAMLAVGGRRLARRGAYLRRLPAAEAMGGVTVVVTDKTGTLTENRPRLKRIDGDRRAVLELALACQDRTVRGRAADPIESELAAAAGAAEVSFNGQLVTTFPFDPERRRSSRIFRDEHGLRVCVMGAPEAVLAVCELGGAERVRAENCAEDLVGMGMRVVVFAERRIAPVSEDLASAAQDATEALVDDDGEPARWVRLEDADEAAPSGWVRWVEDCPQSAEEAEQGLVLVGFAGLEDPLRPGVRAAVAELGDAQVSTILVTGDHPHVAETTAHAAGLPTCGDDVLVGGEALAAMDDAAVAERLVDGAVVARATPADKLRVVRLLQAAGEVVAVTGDGMNDAPALAGADVGIAVGRASTELARQAADIVVDDDAYTAFAAAVRHGRALAAELRRSLAVSLGLRAALVAATLVPLLAGLGAPFSPLQVATVALLGEVGTVVAFAAEPALHEAMREGPRRGGRALGRPELTTLAVVALSLAAGAIGADLAVRLLGAEAAEARAAAAVAWLPATAAVAWLVRRRPSLSLRRNPVFAGWAAVALAAAGVIGGPLAGVLGGPPLGASGWLAAAGGVALAALLALGGRLALRRARP